MKLKTPWDEGNLQLLVNMLTCYELNFFSLRTVFGVPKGLYQENTKKKKTKVVPNAIVLDL